MEQSPFGIITVSISCVVLLANKISDTSKTVVKYPANRKDSSSNSHSKLQVVPIVDLTTQARVFKK